jgi:hypothetical protein
MTVDTARKWLVASSLTITGVMFVFFSIAPVLRFPLTFAQSMRVLEVIAPVFLGYLGSAASFVFRSSADEDSAVFRKSTSSLVGMLIVGPIGIAFLALLAIVAAFGLTNGADAATGAGMTVDQLTVGMSAILGLLAVTTNVAVGYLFGGNHEKGFGGGAGSGGGAASDVASASSGDSGTAS